MYIRYDNFGAIQFWSETPFDECLLADFPVVIVDGRAYREGTEPVPEATPTLSPDALTAGKVTVADVDFLVTKAAEGDRMASLLLRLLEE